MAAAKRAKEAGSTRFCMGAAWRELGNKKKAFNNILDMVSNYLGLALRHPRGFIGLLRLGSVFVFC